MCGICGFVSRKVIRTEQLKTMNDTMYHRGPNDSGEEIYEGKNGYTVGLAQRRLSILDLSPLGHQPMHAGDGRVSVVFNGEIYNFRELREELSGYPFKSHCDTEVILAAYLKWGISCVERFNGMFAIALYDRKSDEVFLIRDRIGKKPLYYWLDNENLVFGSELKPIMACPGFSGELNRKVMRRFMLQQYIQAPDTVFENVYKLEPGSVLKFSGGKTEKWKYWDVGEVYRVKKKNPPSDYGEAKEELKRLLTESVKKRMIADVPLGTFLSGGYDSSLVTAIAQSLSDKPVKTFSIGFSEERYNEAKYAKAVAEYLGCEHTELTIDEKEMYALVESIPRYYDEPFADSSQIPTMLVSKLASDSVTVALSGDGGDEFFCGYNVYQKVAQAQKLDGLGKLAYGISQLPGIRQAGLYDRLPLKVRVIAGNRNPETKTQLSSDHYIRTIRKLLPDGGLSEKYEFESRYQEADWQERRMLLDMDTYLPGDILCKVDRASMKYSLEARCPILDKDVMEYAYSLPHSYKFENGVKKRILKDISYDFIPRELLDRPKVGFAVPLDKWLRGPLRDQLIAMSNTDFLRNQGIFAPEATSRFIEEYLSTGDGGPASGKNYSKIAWSFFTFQQWYLEFKQKQM